MSGSGDESSDFGYSSADEAELVALMDATGYDIAGALGHKLERKLSTGSSKKAKAVAPEQADDSSGQNLKRKLSPGFDEPSKKTKAASEPELVFRVSTEADLLALSNAIGYDVTGTTGYTLTLSTGLDEPSKEAKAAAEPELALRLAVKVLKDTFNHNSFQLKQEQVISRVLSGGSATVVFPTGGGKSLCYQIPALVFSELDKLEGVRGERDGGITLVISPLIALMKDQVDALVKRGIRAAFLDSNKTRDEYCQTCSLLRNGELKLLYCAPERLNNEGFMELVKNVRGGIRLLAIDEAHCISEWGHAFRPDYLKLSRFATEIKAERVICLTATATPRVAKDICDAFGIDDAGLFRAPTYRPNLLLLAESATSKELLYRRLFDFLRANPGATIVYVAIREQAESLANNLKGEGFKAEPFHAGMESMKKAKLQEEFLRRDDLIITATIAFGMGVDKPNIRNVVHFNIPSSVESYSQEIGRAGRDGEASTCMFFLCGDDLYLRDMFVRKDLATVGSIRGLLNDIFDSAVQVPIGGEIQVTHHTQERLYDMQSNTLKCVYAKLELEHGLLRETATCYEKYSFKPGMHYKSHISADNSPAANAIKSYAKRAQSLYHMDITEASRKLNIPRADVINKLNFLHEKQIVNLQVSGVTKVYKILKSPPRTAPEREKLVNALYLDMERREEENQHRADQMLQIVTDKACFVRSLSRHFGDDLADGKLECGHCTWCLTHKAVARPSPPLVPFDRLAFDQILCVVPARDDPRLLARIAFGIQSPRTRALKLPSGIFGSMNDHSFMDLLRAFTTTCDKASQ